MVVQTEKAAKTSIVGGILSVLAVIVYFVISANTHPRINNPLPAYPGFVLEPDQTVRKADMFSLFGTPMDFQVYYRAGEALAQGHSVYHDPFLVTNWGQGYLLPFTYPPFAAWLASFYAKLSMTMATVIWQSVSVLLWVMLLAGMIFYRRHRLSLPVVAFVVVLGIATFAFAPVRSSFYWGQINILVAAMVAADFLWNSRFPEIRDNGWRQDSWAAGIGVGLSAALKVYPAFFGILFIIQRRWRAAIVSVITFFITVGVGFMAVPESGEYWTGILLDTNRFGGIKNVTSQSMQISLIRDFGVQSTALWLLLAGLVTALAAWGARGALTHGNMPVALSLIGLAACVVSPFSWHHYYLWAITLVVALCSAAAWKLAGVCLATSRSSNPAVGNTLGLFGGVLIAALGVSALWPYMSVVFFFPFDIYGLSTSANPFVASATAWWSVLLIAVVSAVCIVRGRMRSPATKSQK